MIPRILVAWSKEGDLTSNGKHCEGFHEEGQRHLLMLKIRFIKVDSSITRFNIAGYDEYWKQFCLLFMMGAHGSVGGWKGRGRFKVIIQSNIHSLKSSNLFMLIKLIHNKTSPIM